MNNRQLISQYKLDQMHRIPEQMDLKKWLKGQQGFIPDDTLAQDAVNALANLFSNKPTKDSEGRTNKERKRELSRITGPSPQEIARRNILRQQAQDAPMNQVEENKFARMARILKNGK